MMDHYGWSDKQIFHAHAPGHTTLYESEGGYRISGIFVVPSLNSSATFGDTIGLHPLTKINYGNKRRRANKVHLITYAFFNLGAKWRWVINATPRQLPPPLAGKTRYPLYRRLCGPHGQSGRVPKISPPPPGFDARTVQPVASRYTDWATPASKLNNTRCCEGIAHVRTKYGNTGVCLRKAAYHVPETSAFSVRF